MTSWRLLFACLLLLVTLPAGSVLAQRPTAPQLLPESTLALVRIPDSRELVKRFQETSMGRIGQDEQVRPLVGQLYSSVAEVFAQIEDEVGLPLDKILAMPQGEVCLAVTAPPSGPPAVVIFFEAGDQLPSVQKLLERLDELAMRDGSDKSTESVGETELVIYTPRNGNSPLGYFEREGLIVMATHVDQLKAILSAWDGKLPKDAQTLGDNRKFTTIMNRCLVSNEESPQFTWFVDPIRLAKVLGRGNATAQIGIALLPALGLDGLQGIGGSATLATEDFDSVMHMHVLIDEPRAGVLEALAVTSGDCTPENWVPNDAATYMTLHFDAKRSLDSATKIYNSIRGDEALQNLIQRNINEPLELDFEQDLLANAAGRFTYMTWIEKPIQIGSQATVVGVALEDKEAFKKVMDKLADKYADNLEKTAFGATPYWLIKVETPRQRAIEAAQEGQRVRLEIRPPQPCFAIVGDYLLISDRPGALEHCIATTADSSRSLATDLEFKLVASKIKRQPGGTAMGMLSFNRPEEGMRMIYDLAKAENTKEFLNSRGEENSFLKSVNKAMEDNPLPPFAVIAQYLAPGGGFLSSDETGFHYASFQMKRK
jgi:hypothetical protein